MLPRTAEYALRAVVWLARTPGESASADALAEATKVPRRYLHKVLQDLVRARILGSRPGPGGGYFLAARPARTSILDVINAVAALERIETCPLGLKSHTTLCPLHSELDCAYATIQRTFAKVTIAKLARSAGAITPLCEV